MSPPASSAASIAPAVFFAIVAYTLSVSAQTYWQLAPLSYYGQLIFLIGAVAAAALLFLACLALYLGDASILLPHSSPAQRRIFCFTCCPARAAAAAVAAAAPPLPHPYAALPSLRWTHLSQSELLLLLGVNNAIASLLQWYSNPPDREPPLVNGLVPTLQALFAVPLARHALGDQRKFLRGGGWLPALAALSIVAGVAVSVAPAAAAAAAAAAPAAAAAAQESSTDVLLWTLLNVASQVPSAMALVGAQAYLLRAGAMEAGAPPARRAVALARFVLYNQAGVGLVTGLCWWLDILPWFGSSSLDSWWRGLRFSIACSLGAGGAGACPPRTSLYAALTVLPYAFYLAGIAAVSGASAVFGNALEVGQSALQTLVWLVPGVNPAPAATPLWSALASAALTLGGVALLRAWEGAQAQPAVTAEGLAPVGEPEARWYGCSSGSGGGGGEEEQGAALLGAEGGEGGSA